MLCILRNLRIPNEQTMRGQMIRYAHEVRQDENKGKTKIQCPPKYSMDGRTRVEAW